MVRTRSGAGGDGPLALPAPAPAPAPAPTPTSTLTPAPTLTATPMPVPVPAPALTPAPATPEAGPSALHESASAPAPSSAAPLATPAIQLSLICQAVDNAYDPIGQPFTLETQSIGLVSELARTVVNVMNVENLPVGTIIPNQLSLWKLQTPWPLPDNDQDIQDINDLLQLFRSDDGRESTAQKLNSFRTLSRYFGANPPDNHIHLIVEAPISGSGEFSAYVLWVSLLSVFAGCSASCTQN